MSDPLSYSLTELARSYRAGDLSCAYVTDRYLEVIEEGPIYLRKTAERARQQARRADERFAQGVDVGPLQGVPIALKDLIDTKGDVTSGGSLVLAEGEPATEDCPAASRLDAAGAVFLGKTNLTELAFSGLGLNPHFGTPGNALDPERIPGGSSSGSGVAVAAHQACAAIGSDTGGSIRVPASFNGIVGLKTTDGSIPLDGCVPLSPTLDTLGPMARTVEDAWHLWQALTATPYSPLEGRGLPACRLLAPTTVVRDGLDSEVEQAFDEACHSFSQAGAVVEHAPVREFAEVFEAYERHGTIVAMEALAVHEELLERHGDRIDPRVSGRIRGGERRAADYIRLCLVRAQLTRSLWDRVRGFDALLVPSVAILPPRIDAFAEDDDYFRLNAKVLRNTMLFNFFACPVVTVPCSARPQGLSVGLSIVGRPRDEALIMGIAQDFERLASGTTPSQ